MSESSEVCLIEQGTIAPYDTWKTEHKCKKCQARFSVAAPNLRHYHWFGTHFRHDYAGFKCTLCGAIDQVKDVPAPIKERVLAEYKSVFDGDDHSIY